MLGGGGGEVGGGGLLGFEREADDERARGHVDDAVLEGDAEGAGKTKVGEFEVAVTVDEKVLGLQITVEHTVGVAEGDPAEHLVQKGLDLHGGEAASGLVLVHVLLQAAVAICYREKKLKELSRLAKDQNSTRSFSDNISHLLILS